MSSRPLATLFGFLLVCVAAAVRADEPGTSAVVRIDKSRVEIDEPGEGLRARANERGDVIARALGSQRARIWRPQLLPGHEEFVFTLYGTPGEPERLRQLIGVLRRERLANGFDPGPAARAGSRALFEVIADNGWPVICYPGYGDMQVKDGRARMSDDDEAALEPLRRAGVFHAIQLGEWGYYFHNLSSAEGWWRAVYGDEFETRRAQMKPPGLAGFDSMPQSRREAYEIVRDYYLTRDRHMRGNNFSVTGHSHYEAYVAEWGSPLIGLELGENIGYTQSKIAFARGASRRWRRPWSGQVSPWFHGSCTTRGPLRMEGKYARGLDAGHSLSLYERMWLHLWFAGAAMVTPENSISIFFENDTDWRLTAHGEKAREVFAFQRAHDRGVPFTPIAVVLDRYSGYNGYKARPWGIFEPTAGDLEVRDLFQEQLFPGSDLIHGPPVRGDPEARYLRPTPFGECCDVLLSNAGAGVLSAYPVVLLVGDIEFGVELVRDLHRVLRAGSRLLVSERHAKALGSHLQALRGTGAVEVVDAWTNPATGRSAAISNARLAELVRSAIPVAVRGDNVHWQVNRNDVGWVVELIHNAGVVKEPTKPAVVDPAVRTTVTITCREPWTTVRRWRGAKPLEVKKDRTVRLELGPGEVEYVEYVVEPSAAIAADGEARS